MCIQLQLLRLGLGDDLGQCGRARVRIRNTAIEIGAQVPLSGLRQRLGGLLVRGLGIGS